MVLKTVYDLQGDAIEKGIEYSFRYRVYNEKGWSDFSDVTSIIAADVPSQPEQPEVVAYASDEITLSFNLGTIDNNGSPITEYRLESD